MIAWGKELESQYREVEARNPKVANLVKRPAKSRENTDDGHANKKMKVEGGGSITDDVRMSYQKGALNKVLTISQTCNLRRSEEVLIWNTNSSRSRT